MLPLLIAAASGSFFVTPRPLHSPVTSVLRRASGCTRALLTEAESTAVDDSMLLGHVLSVSHEGLVAIQPTERELARVGVMLRFSGDGLGVIVAERCGVYFAGSLEGPLPVAQEAAVLLARNLTVPAWGGDTASWGGVYDFLGRRVGAAAVSAVSDIDGLDVFAEPVAAARRRPIGASLHTGVLAIDALAPIGRGQSMMLFGPDALPPGSGRTDLALRIVRAQSELRTGVRSLLVLAEPDAKQRAAVREELREAGVLESVRILEASTLIHSVIAASAACSIAEAGGAEDVRRLASPRHRLRQYCPISLLSPHAPTRQPDGTRVLPAQRTCPRRAPRVSSS